MAAVLLGELKFTLSLQSNKNWWTSKR